MRKETQNPSWNGKQYDWNIMTEKDIEMNLPGAFAPEKSSIGLDSFIPLSGDVELVGRASVLRSSWPGPALTIR